MIKALPEKSADDIKDYCNVLIEDINIMKFGYVTLPKWRKGTYLAMYELNDCEIEKVAKLLKVLMTS
ncbi:hypothetical protein H5410_056708 [Solanum commersonii]|uniref:Uncharacterized protein n=1 Tax=Solanum commersonii TaxID=4109 RepID=A0A9J5WNV7_SOLCO|nr:hypothetical protein H5410_056708 [Solanum commersonii]